MGYNKCKQTADSNCKQTVDLSPSNVNNSWQKLKNVNNLLTVVLYKCKQTADSIKTNVNKQLTLLQQM